MAAATAAAELCNGERLVVLLVIFRVLYSTPLSLFYEAAGICLLAAAGFLIEISADGSPAALQRFKTRSGASSGILLGAVTLPTVILSRLIQFSRALSGYDVKIEDLTYLRMQYWAVSISCLGVLIFLYLVLRSLSVNSSFFPLVRDRKFGLVYLILYTIICCMSLAAESSRGFVVAVKIFWLLSHGLASVGLIWHILRTFPSCASIGEALLVSSGIVLCFGDMMAYTLTKIDPFSFSSKSGYVLYEGKSEISTIIQGMSLSLLLLPALFKFVLQIWVLCSTSRKSEVTDGRRNRDISTSILFYSSFGFMLTIIAPSWMQLVQNFQMHPVLWVCNFVLTEPLKRLSLCFYWISIISLSVLRFYNISKHSKIERILLRKYYHLVAVVMFSPALLFQPKFLDLALGVAFAVFLVLEIIRIWRIWPLGHLIDQFMNAFTDHRDSDILIISHFSLLLGCALPKWISFGFNDRPLAPFAGILSLGIGDTMASVVGHKYGTLRWSKSGKKTIEGTAAGITSVLVASSILLSLLASTGYILSQHWFSLLVAVTASGLLEAYTTQLDNAFIPLIFYSLLCL